MPQVSAALRKVPTGTDGLDALTGGGLPQGRATLVEGPAGSGKTVLALQTLVNGARRWKAPGVFVTLAGFFAQAACARGEPTLFVSFDSETIVKPAERRTPIRCGSWC